MTAQRTWAGIVSVWLLAGVAAVLVAVVSTGDLRFSWLLLALARCSLITFMIQLSTHRMGGFIVGAFVIIGATGVYLSIASLVGG
jgi:hypothetical protein